MDDVDVSAYPLITTYLTVRDQNGVPVPDLTAANFEILENANPRPVTVQNVGTRFNPASNLWVVLALDVSGSMAGTPLEQARAAAIRFLDRLDSNDHVALYAFRDEVDFDTLDPQRELAFTNDTSAWYQFVEQVQAGGRTPLYDAAYKAVLMLDTAPAGQPRALVLFTDGRDEGSARADLNTAATEAQQRGIPVFTIGVGQADVNFIQELARRTGGVYQQAAAAADLGALFDDTATRLKTQYIVTYDSTLPPDGQLHRLTVRVSQAGRDSAPASRTFGPLPYLLTATPIVTPTRPANLTPTAPVFSPSPTPLPPTSPTTADLSGWLWIGAGAVGVWLLWVLVANLIRRRPGGIRCANCGQALGNLPPGQPCPTCQSTRRSG